MWNHDIWGELSLLQSPSLTLHQVIFWIIRLLTQNTYTHTHIDPDCLALIKIDRSHRQNIQTAFKRPVIKILLRREGPCSCVCVCDGGRWEGRISGVTVCVWQECFCGWSPPPDGVVWSASHRRQLPLTNTQQERCLPLGGWVRMCVCMGGSAG